MLSHDTPHCYSIANNKGEGMLIALEAKLFENSSYKK